jgi:hypothetical protein
VSDSELEFNLNPQDNKTLSFESEPKKVFDQTEQDVVFQGGRAIKSKVMSNPMFIATITQFGIDAAKTIILQELLKMSEEEIVQEIKILATIAETELDIKRSLRASKFMAVQWLDDPRRGEEVRNKCQFIIDTIPTFKITGNVIASQAKEPAIIERKEAPVTEENQPIVELDYSFDLPDVQNKPLPPKNPVDAPISSSTVIKKLAKGEKILIITDVQGDYDRFKNTLLKYNIISQTSLHSIRWNPTSKTKLVIVGDLFNKSPYSSWGGQVSYQAFQVVEIVRRLIGEAGDNIFLCLGNYDLKLASGQLFKDTSFGFAGTYSGIKAQAQALPALINYIEGTAFDTENNVYSIWEKVFTAERELFFKLKEDFQVGGRPELLIRSNELNLPDISSIRNFLQALYKELTLPKAERPVNLEDLDKKAAGFVRVKPGENISALADSKERASFFEGLLRGTKTITFLRRFISSMHKFQSERDTISISHVSLQNNIAQMLEKAKEVNWQIPEFTELLVNSKFLKMKKTDPLKFYDDIKKAGFNNLNDFLTQEPEDIFEKLSKSNQLELFIPTFSPNKVKFGYVKGIERMQEGLKMEDKTGLLGFRLVDRKEEKDFDDEQMRKVAELNSSAKQAYADKVVTDLFGSSAGFIVKVSEGKELTAEKGFWKLNIEVDESAALYQDQNKAIHVPIKHIVLVSYFG